MLAGVRWRAERAGVAKAIQLHLAEGESLRLDEIADFALAFWVLHEVPDQSRFLGEVRAALKPDGRFLLVEPRGHVGTIAFARSIDVAHAAGFTPVARPRVAFSRALLFGA